MKFFVSCLALCFIIYTDASAAKLRPIEDPPADYEHNKWGVMPEDVIRQFHGFIVSFDGKDDDNGDGNADILRVPEWVAHHVKIWPSSKGNCIPTGKRPRPWFTDQDLKSSGVAPTDNSYRRSGYDRGHMAAKLLIERLGNDAAWNTHTVLNAIPQHSRFNQQIWRALEDLTGAWAQVYEDIWLIQGPIFDQKVPIAWIGDKKSEEVAIPVAAFKIVIRERTPADGSGEGPMVLAFLMPQLGPGYYGKKSDFRLERFLTSVDEIEKLTNLTFLTTRPDNETKPLKKKRAEALWPVPDKVHFLTGCKKD